MYLRVVTSYKSIYWATILPIQQFRNYCGKQMEYFPLDIPTVAEIFNLSKIKNNTIYLTYICTRLKYYFSRVIALKNIHLFHVSPV